MPTINTESCDVFYLQRQPEERTDTIKVCDGCIEKKNVNMNVFAFTTEDMINKQKHIMSIIGINKNQTHYHDTQTGNDYCLDCYETLDDKYKINLELR